MPVNNNIRPHKRVLLMQPTVSAPNGGGGGNGVAVLEATSEAPASLSNNGGATVTMPAISSDPYAGVGETMRPVRVVAYLSGEESEQLDQLWLKMRGYGVRPSKADIMRIALMHAVDDAEAIAKRVKDAEAAEASAAALTARASRRGR